MMKKTDGRRISTTVLVLLHGFSGSRASWLPLANQISWNGPVLIPDLAGSGAEVWPDWGVASAFDGRNAPMASGGLSLDDGNLDLLNSESPGVDGSKNMEGSCEVGSKSAEWLLDSGMGIMAQAVEAWLDAQGVDSFVVVGHSMGGYVALELLSRIPHRIAGLGLFHSHPLADDEEKRNNRRRSLNLIREVGHTRFMDAFVPALFAPANLESCSDRIQELRAIASNQSPQNICRQIEAMMHRKERLNLLLAHRSLPKWVVLGDQDPVIPLAGAWDWMAGLDNLQLDILPNTAHMGMDECPLHCVGLFEEFNNFVNRAQK